MFHLPRMIQRIGGMPRVVADYTIQQKTPEDTRPFIPPGLSDDEHEHDREETTTSDDSDGMVAVRDEITGSPISPDFPPRGGGVAFMHSGAPIPNLSAPVIPNSLYTIRAYRYRTSRNSWKHVPNLSPEEVRDILEDPDDDADSPDGGTKYPSTLRIVTWNVDFNSPHAKERMGAALRHIERDVLLCSPGQAPFEPVVICLQEVRDDVLPVILHDEWVKRHFLVAPISPNKWPEGAKYGLVTLVSRVHLRVARCEIMHFGASTMGRAALAVYVLLREPEPSRAGAQICVVNTHLESLPMGAVARPKQMELAARFLKQNDVRGGVVVGDMNAIAPEEVGLPMECGLRDVWRGGEREKGGYTWGYQGQNLAQDRRTKYPCGRLDKILYLPRRGYRMDPLERVGVGVKAKNVPGEPWVSDHYGLMSTLRLIPRRNSA